MLTLGATFFTTTIGTEEVAVVNESVGLSENFSESFLFLRVLLIDSSLLVEG